MSKKKINETTEYSLADMQENTDRNIIKKRSKKTNAILTAVVTVVLIIASVCLLEYPSIVRFFSDLNKSDYNSMYSDELNSYIFYPSDYDLDVTTVPEYMELDRNLYYSVNGETIAIPDGELEKYGEAITFFGKYFKTVIAGDTPTYNTYFTKKYYETNKPYELFAPQMLYDINVKLLSRKASDDATVYAFDVWYKIYRNDGTFRNDIPSDASKRLYFELIAQDGNVLIDRITYYK